MKYTVYNLELGSVSIEIEKQKKNFKLIPCVRRKFCLFNISSKTVVVSSLQINNVSDVFYVFLKYIKTLSKRFFGNESGKIYNAQPRQVKSLTSLRIDES